MLKIFTGNDRTKAQQEIKRTLGNNYEIIEGADLAPSDLPSIFKGTTLFADTRRVLIRDLSINKPAFEKLPDYLDTPHDIILLEFQLDKRSTTYKALKNQIEIKDFKLPDVHGQFYSFDICRTAKHDGRKAVKMLREIELTTDPIMFFGALVSVALKDYRQHQGTKEKRALKELAKTDIALKTTAIDPWLLIEGFLLNYKHDG